MQPLSIALAWDDDFELLLLMRYLCNERGYRFEHITTFDVAYARWCQQRPDVALIKRSLQHDNDGLAFCATLRADAHLKALPIIMGWADLGSHTFDEAYAAGANGCFGRVFDIGGIFTMIEQLARAPTHTHLVDQAIPRRRS